MNSKQVTRPTTDMADSYPIPLGLRDVVVVLSISKRIKQPLSQKGLL